MNVTQYSQNLTPDAQNQLSMSIWADCPQTEIRNGIQRGWYQADDFTELSITGTQTAELLGVGGKYKLFNASGATSTAAWQANQNAIPTTDSPGGYLRGQCNTNGHSAAFGYHGTPFILSPTAGKLWGEARIAMTGIATDNTQVFVGLAENGVAAYSATVPLGDADVANTSMGMIGFNVLEDGLGRLNAAYQDRATAWVNPTGGTNIGQMAANTFIKVGWKYDPANSLEAFQWFVNGVKRASISGTTLANLTNIDVRGLGLCLAMYADASGTANFVYLDWWQCFQVAP